MIRTLVLVLAFLVAAPALAQTYPPLTGRVVDLADLLTPEQEAELTGRLEALQAASTRQLVVATFANLGGRTIEEYGVGLGRAWGIGQRQANNGVVLIVAREERKVRIEVGYGLEGIVTDAIASRIIRNDIVPRFRAGDYAGGINAGADALIAQLQAPPEAAEANARQAAAAESGKSRRGGGSFLPLIFWVVVLLFVLFSMIRRGIGGKRYRRGRRGPVIIWGPGLGGGWGGGGGRSWGGGGGFSGGGGSFGGGGASGGW